ncbi:MAG: hypothetical protein FWD76_03330 [Firmicutes bacterium]|nr:hypothetical protein [Bacillota bacterium]
MADERIQVRGFTNLMTCPLNAESNDYLGTSKKWYGEVSINVKFTKPKKVFAASDDPAWAVRYGAITGSGTLVLRGIKHEDYVELLPVLASETEGVRFGEDLPEQFFGLSFTQESTDGSTDKMILYKVIVDGDPDIDAKTVDDAGNEFVDLTFNISVYPVFYPKKDGGRGRVIRDIVNSKANADHFAELADTILFPQEFETQEETRIQKIERKAQRVKAKTDTKSDDKDTL